MNTERGPRVSVVIVNYKVPDFLCQTLKSLAGSDEACEIIVVDNASEDASKSLVSSSFPDAKWIGLKRNIGFGKACNVGARAASGTYILFLNPDTIVSAGTIRTLANHLESNAHIGACGPRILNADGSFQTPCRRSFPTPVNALAYFTGLSRLFPSSKTFGAYNLSHLDPLESCKVDAVSGSCIMIRSELFNAIGGFDPAFFMYGEDLDLCAQVAKAGFAVWYCAETSIIHFKGKSSARKAVRTRIAFYEAMILFSRKYTHSYGAYLPRWFIGIGIMLLGAVSVVSTITKTSLAAITGLVLQNTIFAVVLIARFHNRHMVNLYLENSSQMVLAHTILSVTFMSINFLRGIYNAGKYSSRNLVYSTVLASGIFMTVAYLSKELSFSRLSFLISFPLILLFTLMWRRLVPSLSKLHRKIYSTGSVIVVGSGEVARRVIRQIEGDSTAEIKGIILSKQEDAAAVSGYPVLGGLDELIHIVKEHDPAMIVFATHDNWYSYIVEALPIFSGRNLAIRWVSQDIFSTDTSELPAEITLKNFSL